MKKKLSFQKALAIIAAALGLPYASVLRIFKGHAADAIRIATLKNVRAGFERWIESRNVEEIMRRRKTSKDIARKVYKFRTKVGKRRLQAMVFASPKHPPKGLTKNEAEKLGHKITRGKNKGKWIVWKDTIFNLPVGDKAVQRLRRELQLERITVNLYETPYHLMADFKKFVPADLKKKLRQRKDQKLTLGEARQIARKIKAKLRKGDTFKKFQDVFGDSP